MRRNVRGVTRSFPKLALVAVFLLPALLLAWLGFTALRSETERGTALYREQAEAALDAVLARLSAARTALERGQGQALQIAFGADGVWLGRTLARAENAQSVPHDALLLATLEAEVDRLEAAGELEQAIERTRPVANDPHDPELAAWALETRALLCAKLGLAEDAAAARRELLERFPDARTPHGLRRAWVARRELARAAPNGTSQLADLYADAAADHVSLDDTATAEFVRGLRVELAERLATAPDAALAARVAVTDREDAERARLRRWLASVPRGVSDWIAGGAAGGARVLELVDEPISSANPLRRAVGAERVLVAVTRDGDGWSGGALELERLFAEARSADAASALGFRATIEPAELAPDEQPIARRRLSAPLEAFEARVAGGDFTSFLAGERRKLYLSGALVASVLALALVAAFATLRAVGREVEAAQGREAFVAAVTHELKAPLAAIRLFAEVLERGDVEPEKVREFGARTVRESDRLARLVEGVLDLARLEHGVAGPRREPVDLRELAERALANVAPLARERGFELVLRAAQPLAALGDRDALQGALVNLLDNALKYSDVPHTIEVELRRAGERAELAVLDRGRGVPEAERARIFEPFRRVGDELTRDRPGVGLGLALVQRIARAHGGDARCEAREGGGSVFVLSLPLPT